MSSAESELKLMSNEELEASLQSGAGSLVPEEVKASYDGHERRSGEDRRNGPTDRRALVRYEPEKGQSDRRDGKDRRSHTRAPDLSDRKDS